MDSRKWAAALAATGVVAVGAPFASAGNSSSNSSSNSSDNSSAKKRKKKRC